ncbi:MAG: acyl-CoA dehydrogenase family protein, partial [Planctomycetes bacterium]|nr:acyl-CoA dehydrogenase family protein [Planctomycetota bacterium]
MHNFELSEEHTMVLESMRKLVDEVAAKVALERDEHRQFARESVDGIAELGLFGMSVSEAGGGAGLGHLALVVAVEACAEACGSSARMLLTQAGVCAIALDGLEAAAETLERIMMGEALGAFVGLDGPIRASGDGDTVTLDGTAELVTGAGEAGVLLVAAS